MQKQQTANPDPKSNRLLASLGRTEYDAVIQSATLITLRFRTRLSSAKTVLSTLSIFLYPAWCRCLVTTDGRPQVEIATIGNEGVVGASELIQAQGAMGLNLVQLPGAAVRVEAGTPSVDC
jgi:hypothetical protein